MSNKYEVKIVGLDGTVTTVDVYRVIDAFTVTCPALQHLVKKALKPGDRGHKSIEEDLDDIEDAAIKAKGLHESRKLKSCQ